MFDGVSSEVLSVAFFVVMVLMYRRQQAFISLLKFPLRLAEPERVERSTMPPQTAQLLDGARQELESAGFQYEFTRAAPPMNAVDPRPLAYVELYWNPEESTLAYVTLAEPHTGQAVATTFVTAFADGKRLVTTNRILWSLFPALDEYIRQDAYADNFWDQWKFHQAALATEAARCAVVSGMNEVLQSERGSMARLFAHLQSIRWIREESPGMFRFTPRGAWLYARKQLREVKQAQASLKRPYQHAHTPGLEALRSAEMSGFATTIELAAQPMPNWLKAALFGVTLLVSLLLFGNLISFTGAIALLLVLLVHELGHLAAMWAFGFRNLSILFLPLLGAVATGHKTHVKPWQEAVILLAGPVPGLVAALALAQVPVAGMAPWAAEFLRMTFWFALLINLFNLLPVSMLDGGKLFQLAVLSRFPYVRAVFGAVGSAVGLVYAVVNGSVVLAVATVFLLLGMANQFRAAKAVSSIRARAKAEGLAAPGQALDKEAAISMLGQHLARPEFNEAHARGWLRRTVIAGIAYPRLLQGVPRLPASLGVLAAHSLAFFAPMFIAALLMQQPGKAPIMRQAQAVPDEARQQAGAKREEKQRALREEFKVRYAASGDAQEKWAMLDDAEDEDASPLDLDESWVAQERRGLLPRLPADHPARLEPLLEQARSGGPNAAELVLSVIAQLTQASGARIVNMDDGRFFTLARALDALQEHAAPAALVAQDALLEAGWAQMQGPARDDAGRARLAWRKPMLAATAAHLAFAVGDPARAETWMARKASCDSSSNPYSGLDQAWFQLDLGHADQAQERAARAINAPGVQDYARDEWLALAGWVEMSRGRARAADVYFLQALHDRDSRQNGTEDRYNVITWLLGVIQGRQAPRGAAAVNGAMLDHLAALQGYDPREAARYRAELAGRMTPEWKQYFVPYLMHNLKFGGWGRLRSATIAKMLEGGN